MSDTTDILRVRLHDLAAAGNPIASIYEFRLVMAHDADAEAEVIKTEIVHTVSKAVAAFKKVQPYIREIYDSAGPN